MKRVCSLANDADSFIDNRTSAQADSGPQKIGRLLENGQKPEGVDDTPTEHHEEEDGPWYFGKAKEEFHKRRTQAGNARRGEEDPIQVCVFFFLIFWT